MKQYKTIEDAKKDNENLGKYDIQAVMVKDKPTLLCGTPMVEDDLYENQLTNIFNNIDKYLIADGIEIPDYDATSLAKQIVEHIENVLNKEHNIQIDFITTEY